MLAVILCGGNSSRMGNDKGLLELKSEAWAKIAADKLSTLQIPVVLSVHAKQYESYSSIFPTLSLITDAQLLSIKGPLAGILSVHLHSPKDDLFVLACDMPLMEASILTQLLSSYKQHNNADAFIFSTHNEPEPLCGIYTAKSLAYTLHLYQTGKLLKHSMKYMLEQISVQVIPVAENETAFFKNFNAKTDLNGL